MRATEFITEGTLSVDVPNEDWLQDKIDYAKSKGRNSFGVPYMGSTTPYTSQNQRVPVDILRQLPGMRGEQKNVRKDDLQAIVKIMKDTGKLPTMDNGKEYAPFINVAWNGEAWVNEGNHRIMAATALGWKDLPVQISYFDGGERIESGPMYPGKIGLSEGLDEDWKSTLATGAMAAAMAMGAQGKPAQTTAQYTSKPAAVAQTAKPAENILKKTAMAAGIRGIELAQFLAQCAHETADFTNMKEFGGSLDFRKYDPKHNPRKAKILGNKQAGDGALYKGRGYIQLTGRENYKRAGQALGLPLEQQPKLAERPDIAAKIAVWYWQTRVKPFVQNFEDTRAVTKKINAGLAGLADRQENFKDYKLQVAMR